ncbi:hypothetical protein N6H14_19120 [Paenibacillus sp. CC-CFT747]|nr:hypothetical protein N6H14_19120 [Paenibacillus sp. CC-CFT747]
MSGRGRENRIKLDILESLAESQKALARILTSAADCSAASDPLAVHIRDNLDAISRCQRQLAVHFFGLTFRKRRRSRPGKLWLHARLRQMTNPYRYPAAFPAKKR